MLKNIKFGFITILLSILSATITGCGGDQLGEVQNLPAKAVISGGDRQAINNTSVTFDGSKSYDRDGVITNFAWDFGEGTVLASAGNNVAHVYTEPGIYDVALTVMDDGGSADSTSIRVEILEAGSNIQPSAKIWGASENILPPALVNSGEEIIFTGIGTDSDGSISSWSWNFGDGSSEDPGALQPDGRTNTVKHTFVNQSGAQRTYHIVLSVSDNLNAVGSASQSIVVNPEEGSDNADDYSGLWYWQLQEGEAVDPSGMGLCSFQDSELNIQTNMNAGTITIEELLNGQAQATYSGNLSGTSFQTTDSTGLQTISGNFDGLTSFSGSYTVDTMGFLAECEIPRSVEGMKQ